MHRLLRTVALTMLLARPAAAEWQLKPFFGATFGGETTFTDLESAAGSLKFALGASATLIGEVVGIEGDFAYVPGYFQTGTQSSAASVVSSDVMTLVGNIVVAMPRRVVEYSLRPYFVGGAGLMRVRIDDFAGVLRVTRTLPAIDVGGGIAGFLSDRVGIGWDVRHFGSIARSGDTARGVSIGPEQLSFWRATMTLVVRY